MTHASRRWRAEADAGRCDCTLRAQHSCHDVLQEGTSTTSDFCVVSNRFAAIVHTRVQYNWKGGSSRCRTVSAVRLMATLPGRAVGPRGSTLSGGVRGGGCARTC